MCTNFGNAHDKLECVYLKKKSYALYERMGTFQTPGPLNVSIHATDPDSPGKLLYELQDPTGG